MAHKYRHPKTAYFMPLSDTRKLLICEEQNPSLNKTKQKQTQKKKRTKKKPNMKKTTVTSPHAGTQKQRDLVTPTPSCMVLLPMKGKVKGVGAWGSEEN